MNKQHILVLVVIAFAIAGCSAQFAFNKGVSDLSKIDSKYGMSLKEPPKTTENIDSVISELNQFKDSNELESLEMLADFRIKFLESQKLYLEGWQWGTASTTEFGFGCKGYDRITESAGLRNDSANAGFEAIAILEKFVDSYPKEAKSIDMSQKDVLFLKAIYFQEQEKASRDASIIKSLCREQANQTGV